MQGTRMRSGATAGLQLAWRRRRCARWVAPAVAATALILPAVAGAAGYANPSRYVCTPNTYQLETVKPGVTRVAIGAEGAFGRFGAGTAAGRGGTPERVGGQYNVQPGDALYILVGCSDPTSQPYSGGAGGKGPDSGEDGGSGGGASVVQLVRGDGQAPVTLMIAAGGGGGGGEGLSASRFGGAGGSVGVNAGNGSSAPESGGGDGGAGGATSGTGARGQDGRSSGSGGGGGGGGGCNGGGGGQGGVVGAGGGGGGAGRSCFYTGPLTFSDPGVRQGNSADVEVGQYLPDPVLSSVTPRLLPLSGGTVRVEGRYLTQTMALTGEGSAPSGVTCNASRTVCDLTLPSRAAGTRDLTVVGDFEASVGSSNALTVEYVATPTLTSLSPSSGQAAGGIAVTLSGTNLARATGARVGTTDVAVRNCTASSCTITMPSRATVGTDTPGVVVTSPGGTSGARTFTYTYPPEITSFTPDAGPAAGGTSVSITGQRLAGVTQIRFGTVAAVSFSCSSATACTAVAPSGTAGADVTISATNPATGTGTSTKPYHYNASARIDRVEPANGPTAGGQTVRIFGETSGLTSVTFGGTSATILDCTPTFCDVRTPARPAGAVTVAIAGPTGTASLASAYRYRDPAYFGGIFPGDGPIAGGTPVRIFGESLSTVTEIRVGEARLTDLSCSATECTGTTSEVAAPGQRTITATVPDDVGVRADSSPLVFDYLGRPRIDTVTDASGPAQGGAVVTLVGENLKFGTVRFNGAVAEGWTCLSPSVCFGPAPAGTGAGLVTVESSGGTSAPVTYTWVPVPRIFGVEPGEAAEQGGTRVTITGEGLHPDIRIGDVPAADVTCAADGTSCELTAPPGTGSQPITSTSPVSGVSPDDGARLRYAPVPTLTAVTPAQGPASGGTLVTLTGSDLTTDIRFGDVPAIDVSCASATTCTATAPPGTGTVAVTVRSASGTSASSAGATFAYIAPDPPAPAPAAPAPGSSTQGSTLGTLPPAPVAPASTPARTTTARLGLPATRSCGSRRAFRITIPKARLRGARSVTILVDGKRRARLTGRRLRRPVVDLRGLPRTAVVVRVVVTRRSGPSLVQQRRYRTCARRR